MSTIAVPNPRVWAQIQLHVQVQIDLLALRHGLRPGNLTVQWNAGAMDMTNGTHDLVISASHGAHSVTVALDHDALMSHDEPRYLPKLELALAKLKQMAS